MNKQNDLPLYIAIFKLLKYLYLLVQRFKKEYKYTLGQSIIDCTWEILDKIFTTNTLPNTQKAKYIRQASTSFDKLKIRLRVAYELNLIAYKQYTYIISQNEEIAKMLNGWLKWAENQSCVNARK